LGPVVWEVPLMEDVGSVRKATGNGEAAIGSPDARGTIKWATVLYSCLWAAGTSSGDVGTASGKCWCRRWTHWRERHH
jgi:hypothetical protein